MLLIQAIALNLPNVSARDGFGHRGRCVTACTGVRPAITSCVCSERADFLNCFFREFVVFYHVFVFFT
jgi:hypothetical protein